MIKPLLLACLGLHATVSAQKLAATHPSVTYKVGKEPAYLYREPADTVSKSRQFISAGDDAYVVGEFSPRWAVVKRMGELYMTPTENLADYNLARIKADRAADAAGLPIDSQTKLITYQGVVEVPGVAKDELYRRAYEWVAQTYRSANAVIQMQDKEAGQLIAKGLMQVVIKSLGMNMDGGVVRHTLTIYVKDGRYKYILTNLAHEDLRLKSPSIGPLERQELPFGVTKKVWANIKRDANRDAYRLVAELETAMSLRGNKNPSDF